VWTVDVVSDGSERMRSFALKSSKQDVYSRN